MQKDMIRVTRYRRDPRLAEPFPAAGLPLPFAPSSIRWAGTPTNTVDGGGGPNWSTENRTWSPLAAPWGEAGERFQHETIAGPLTRFHRECSECRLIV